MQQLQLDAALQKQQVVAKYPHTDGQFERSIHLLTHQAGSSADAAAVDVSLGGVAGVVVGLACVEGGAEAYPDTDAQYHDPPPSAWQRQQQQGPSGFGAWSAVLEAEAGAGGAGGGECEEEGGEGEGGGWAPGMEPAQGDEGAGPDGRRVRRRGDGSGPDEAGRNADAETTTAGTGPEVGVAMQSPAGTYQADAESGHGYGSAASHRQQAHTLSYSQQQHSAGRDQLKVLYPALPLHELGYSFGPDGNVVGCGPQAGVVGHGYGAVQHGEGGAAREVYSQQERGAEAGSAVAAAGRGGQHGGSLGGGGLLAAFQSWQAVVEEVVVGGVMAGAAVYEAGVVEGCSGKQAEQEADDSLCLLAGYGSSSDGEGEGQQ